jgi:protein tyrosine phosphatase (PTP) superfamily phosphohydrolase (DUF442 family)
MLGDITNYFQMTELVATSGQPTKEQFAEIAEAGFDAVVNLAMTTGENALLDEGSVIAGLGMTYIHIPVPWEAPTTDHLNQYLSVMKALEPKRVWVHCVVNARVSAFNYHYLKNRVELTEKSCRSPLLEKWEPQMEDQWKAFLAISRKEMTALDAA